MPLSARLCSIDRGSLIGAVLLLLAGCCPLSQIETVLAPPQIDPAERQDIDAMIATPPRMATAFTDSGALDLSTADRCDILDPTHCLLPFPNDYFTVESSETDTGRQLSLDPESMPANHRGQSIDPTAWGASDGFSPGSMILTRVPGLALVKSDAPLITNPQRSLEDDSPILVLDAETGDKHLIWAELDAHAEGTGRQALMVRPAESFHEGRRYIVVLRRLLDADGGPLEPSRGFAIYRDRIPHDAPVVEARRAHMEDIFSRLERAGVARDDLYLAWDFTVSSSRGLSERLLHMRDDAFDRLGDEAPGFQVLCRKKREGQPRRIWGSFEVPAYLSGNGGPGSHLVLGDDGLPRHTGSFTAYFSCIVPESARDRPARLALYGHGLLNSLDEVDAGNLHAMANDHGFAFCATNWSGLSAPDTLQAVRFLRDASEFPPIADRLHQGILNTLFLGRLMIHPEGLVSHRAFRDRDGSPLIDTSSLVFDGNSQGTVIGGAANAVAQDWSRATLGVSGMNYSLFLRRSADFGSPRLSLLGVDFPSFQEIFTHAYPDPLDQPLVLALIQMLWDRAELNGHARHLVGDPYPDTPAKRVLLHEAFGDQALVNVATEVMARTVGAHLYQPALRPGRDPRPDPHFGIPPIPALPFEGSALVVWDDGSPATPLENLPPPKKDDPHGVVRSQEAAQRQKAEFLKTGRVIDVCGGQPCLACGAVPEPPYCPPE